MFVRVFGWSIGVAVIGLVLGWVYDGPTGLALVAILAVLEVSLSFDNAVVNATVLVRMSPWWQRIFLTVGVVIAVFGMRLVFPLVIVSLSAHESPIGALQLALEKGDPATPGTYGYLLNEAHPAIASFGGMFLLMLFLDFVLDPDRERTWLTWLERPLQRIGRLDQVSVVVALAVLAVVAVTAGRHADLHEGAPTVDRSAVVLLGGVLGVATYLLVNGLGELFHVSDPEGDGDEEVHVGPDGTPLAVGKAAFFLFCYLEVLDASFSFDGVIGAFAITSDPVVIALGLGIGAMFIRSLTVLLVRTGTLQSYVYLESGALWAIGALAAILLVTIAHEVPQLLTGLVGIAFIAAAVASSVVHNRRRAQR